MAERAGTEGNFSLKITGTKDLEALAVRLKAAGDHGKGLKKELLKAFRDSTKDTKKKIRQSALDNLPRKGGLAKIISQSRISTTTRMTGRQVGVKIVAKNRHDIAKLNRGQLRHPLFGDRQIWFGQAVPMGWFDKPIREDIDNIRVELLAAMKRTASKIED